MPCPSRRPWAALIVVLAAGLALAACQGNANNGVSSGTATAGTAPSTASVSATKTNGTVTSVATAATTLSTTSSTKAGLGANAALTFGAFNQSASAACGTASATTTATGTRAAVLSNLEIPPPPGSTLLTTATAQFSADATSSATVGQSSRSGGAGASPLGSPMVRRYQSSCTADQVVTFYQQALLGAGWTGNFDTPSATPLASVTQTTTSSAAPGSPAYSARAPRVGAFIGVTPTTAVTLFVTVQGATGTSGGAGPTTVDVVEQTVPRQATS